MANKETSLKELIQGMIPKEIELLQGTVISTNPLSVQIANDSKLVLSKLSLVIPHHLKDHTENVVISDSSGQRNATITVQNALAVGERVHILSLQSGKKYYVLDRI
jgi:hypothetical protein